MSWPPQPHILLFAAVSALTLLYAGVVWRHRGSPGAIPLFVLFLLVAVWSAGYTFELWLVAASSKVLAAKVQYIGIAYTAVAWLFFVLVQSGRRRWLTPRLVGLVCVAPTVILVLAWTNEAHGLLWRSLEVAPPPGPAVLVVTYGPFFWIHVAYSYAAILLGAILLLGSLLRQPQIFRRQSLLLFAVVLTPWLGNMAHIAGADFLSGLDLTVLGFAVSGLVMARLFLGGDLLDVVPIARHTVFDEMLDGVLVLNTRGDLVDANRAAAEMLSGSVDDLVGGTRDEVLSRLSPATEGGRSFLSSGSGEGTRSYDVTEVPLTDRKAREVGRLVVLRDVSDQLAADRRQREMHRSLEERVRERTQELLDANARLIQEIAERKRAEARRNRLVEEKARLEAQVRHSQKLETLGTLAGGIAHDFNNVLAAIMGYAEMARAQTAPGGPVSEDLDQVVGAANRAKDLVRQILTFSRRVEPNREPVDLAEPVGEAIRMLRASIPTTVELREYVDPVLPEALADSTQIHQVVMNLGTNAAHAMEDGGGVLEVRLEQAKCGPDRLLGRRPEDWIQIVVSDTGTGMPHEVMDQIFEPFFTTKATGHGTGLGLSVVHGIVEAHDGNVQVESELGRGTRFTIRLPVGRTPTKPGAAQPDAASVGTEVVLLVDDEPQIARLGTRLLSRLGFTVVSTTSSQEALDLFSRDPARFDVLVTDQTMPLMTGDQLAREVLRIRPDLPVVLTTGFSKTMTEERCKELGIRELVMKPSSAAELGAAIRRALDGGSGGGGTAST